MNAFAVVFLVLSQGVKAHYNLAHISVNGGPVSREWQYVRNTTKGPVTEETFGESNDFAPNFDLYDENIRCGRGAAAHGSWTETLDVNAGDVVSFFGSQHGDIEDFGIYHQTSIGQAYLSRAPNTLEEYRGDGDWFKIGAILADTNSSWVFTERKYSMNFTIPPTTPPGKYLLRAE
ncbi:lytic polysaccharide monooxygenase [Melanomma pulvis-pyrius CBS 109.77]|uniref:lytic cellulose monooxygenase (C4-dehydrogenating) n=1 Tax=Melanomma pulvis-pyrius CBS 109.77 TaxID=1314802 RepID=A0A6A6WY87_9PLEO|nr:lytic polysaccharide monooxygenase [Melanomma pulvis-pyrius CBS 109.77]